MKTNILCVLMALAILSCTHEKQNENTATIKGEVVGGRVKKVNFEWIIDNPIIGRGETYEAELDSNANFSIEIPLKRLANGRVRVGRFSHDISLLPGDDLFITINADTIRYTGKGAAKNNYLYQSEVDGVNNWAYYRIGGRKNLTPAEFLTALKKFKQKRVNYFESYIDSVSLDKEFIDFYKVDTEVIYENQIHSYPRRYAYMNKTHRDSLDLPEEYKQLNCFSNFVDDSKVMNSSYLHNLRNKIFDKAGEIKKVDASLNWEEAKHIAIFDSLSGKSREYILTKWILSGFGHDEYDSIAINKFNEIEKDALAQESFNAGLAKFNEKRALIGQPLHPEFAQTLLRDTSEVELTFGEMMKTHKGKVVYLDIWSLGCGPCIAAMPNSKKLKDKLSDLPIEFVYISQDRPNNKLWDNIFAKTFTKHNQFRMVNSQWGTSRMLKFMEMNWVPCYMIFDKEGHLYDFNADRPMNNVDKVETELEKTLRTLAAK